MGTRAIKTSYGTFNSLQDASSKLGFSYNDAMYLIRKGQSQKKTVELMVKFLSTVHEYKGNYPYIGDIIYKSYNGQPLTTDEIRKIKDQCILGFNKDIIASKENIVYWCRV